MNKEKVISDDDVRFYHENGYLVVRGVLAPDELRTLQNATQVMMDAGRPGTPDYSYKGDVLARIEYVQDKDPALLALLAHPFILRSVETLMGRDFLPTWDAMVVKMPGQGVAVPWHRDAATDSPSDKPIFNVDFYLDEATEQNCVWVMPGTNKMEKAEAEAWIRANRNYDHTADDYRKTGALPVLMQSGDVLFHDILVLHGSPTSTADALRRVVYYEFRTAHVETSVGPHTPPYIPLKQAVLRGSLRERQAQMPVANETPFVYNPPAPFDAPTGDTPPTYRYAHSEYWRNTAA